jgi:hypothetical protein
MTVHVDHASLPVGSLLHVTVTVAAASGSLTGLTVVYGDGQRYSVPVPAVACPVPPATPKPAPPSREVQSFVASYRVPAVETLTVDARTGGVCAPAPSEHLVAHLRVRASRGPVLTNGRQLPSPMQVDVVLPPPTPRKGVTYLGGYLIRADPDGFLRAYVWDFGDGTLSVSDTRPFSWCHDDGRTWPTSTDPKSGFSRMAHRYARPGAYRVRVTVISSGCSGGDRQQVSSTSTITAKA